MRDAALALALLAAGVAGYYAWIHVSWRREVRRRRLEREQLRARYRTGRMWRIDID